MIDGGAAAIASSFRSVLFLLLALACALAARAADGSDPDALRYVGGAICAGCHAEPAAQWGKSDHARSMQAAVPGTVLGNFNDVRFTHQGVSSHFSRRGRRYFVRTDGPDGKAREFAVAYTFGHYPLQQYLIEIPGGRLQALGIAWDSRPAGAGGQRWFHLYPDDKLRAGETAHWTGRDQNWNFMCASCHSTALKKNFDPAKNRFKTTWSEINISCEACHGPGSVHVALPSGKGLAAEGSKGLVVNLRRSRDLAWRFATPDARIAAPAGDIDAARTEADACFPCHSLRQELGAPQPGKPFLDNYLPTLIEKGLYHADGQIDGEVFEYGAFSQSRMYRAGVSCGNCHDAHSLKLKADGNSLCAQCHQAGNYDNPQHHRHQAKSEGARCVACHMPTKTYMGIDVRRDHGFRRPNPGTAAALGTPDACAQCHADRPAGWSATTLTTWGVKAGEGGPETAAALAGLWRGSAQAPRRLAEAAQFAGQSGFLRASVLALLSPAGGSASRQAIARAVADPDPLVRLGAARALAAFAPEEQVRLGGPVLLDDALRGVRIEAARALVGIPEAQLDAARLRSYRAALGELVAFEKANAERPESHLNLAQIFARRGLSGDAEKALHDALRLDRRFVPAYINLADLYRALGRDRAGEKSLEQARRVAPHDAAPLHALALLRIRQGKKDAAVPLLRQAVALAPGNAQYAYLLALAFAETGAGDDALTTIKIARRQQPDDDALRQLQIILERRKQTSSAAGY